MWFAVKGESQQQQNDCGLWQCPGKPPWFLVLLLRWGKMWNGILCFLEVGGRNHYLLLLFTSLLFQLLFFPSYVPRQERLNGSQGLVTGVIKFIFAPNVQKSLLHF